MVNKEDVIEIGKMHKELHDKKRLYTDLLGEFNRHNSELNERIIQLEREISNKEHALRTKAFDEFKATGNKDLGFGVKAQIQNKMDYNKDEALIFCKEHFPEAIEEHINDTIFKGAIKNGRINPECVDRSTYPKITLPMKRFTDLVNKDELSD